MSLLSALRAIARAVTPKKKTTLCLACGAASTTGHMCAACRSWREQSRDLAFVDRWVEATNLEPMQEHVDVRRAVEALRRRLP